VVFRQSNAEHQFIDWIHQAIDEGAGALIINPAGLTFTSVPIMAALNMFPGQVFGVHLTNIHRREAVYQHSADVQGRQRCPLRAGSAGLPRGHRRGLGTGASWTFGAVYSGRHPVPDRSAGRRDCCHIGL
jgi:hypothetical protein